ncbi:hypothetical protein K438DRAFT_857222 [Mycena galopus ATCC 62051]|nr:hypothetical protein K438DRAFT_857222 [Mycena galopus ATCC 62051]
MKEFNLARSRAGAIGADLNAAADALARTRGALDAFRRSVFEGLQSGEEGSGLPSPPSYASSQPDVQVTMPRGPGDVGSSYTPPSYSGYSPPPGPPPAGGSSGTSSPPPSMPAMPMPSMPSLSSLSISSSSTTYAPPPGPPPTQTQTQTQRPETQSTSYAPPLGPPPGPAGARAASPSAWGSRNPYAAALAKGESPAGGSGAGEEEGAGVSGPPVPPKS